METLCQSMPIIDMTSIFSEFPCSQLMFSQNLRHSIVCLMISHKIMTYRSCTIVNENNKSIELMRDV